jgi:hypothetical protein
MSQKHVSERAPSLHHFPLRRVEASRFSLHHFPVLRLIVGILSAHIFFKNYFSVVDHGDDSRDPIWLYRLNCHPTSAWFVGCCLARSAWTRGGCSDLYGTLLRIS